MANKNNVNIGNSGEYFVAAELERRGFSAAIMMSNAQNFDILAINRKNYEQWAIQVKTTKKDKKEWLLSAKNENISNDNIVYIFVSLKNLDAPEYHIVHSKTVTEIIEKGHADWLEKLGKDGKKHKDSTIRKFNDKDDKYLNNWQLLM